MNKTKVLITGSNGLLGQKLVNLFVANNFDVIATSKGKNRNPLTDNYEYFNANITNFDKIYKFIKKAQPNFIINTAAMTNVDSCELRKRECKEINAKVVKLLAKTSEEFNIHLIQISTDFVFKGKKGYYSETDKPNPINYYGETKLKSEKYLKKYAIDYTILRTIILYGLIENSTKNNFVLWVKNSLEQGKSINIVTDQYRMPTYVNDLAFACLQVVNKKAKGIYHISSSKLMSIYEMALEVANTFDLDKSLIKPILTEKLNQKALRPVKTGFKIEKAIKELNFVPITFKDQLQIFKEEFENKKTQQTKI